MTVWRSASMHITRNLKQKAAWYNSASITVVLFTLDSLIYKSWDSLSDKGSYCQQIPRKDKNQWTINQLTLFSKMTQYFFRKAWLNSIFHGDLFQLVCWLEFIWWKWDWLVFIVTEKKMSGMSVAHWHVFTMGACNTKRVYLRLTLLPVGWMAFSLDVLTIWKIFIITSLILEVAFQHVITWGHKITSPSCWWWASVVQTLELMWHVCDLPCW